MNLFGLGTEIVEVLRIAKLIERHGEEFLNRILTPRELKYCQNRSSTNQLYAALWCCKQAILRGAGIPWQRTLSWTDLEIRPARKGHIKVLLRGSIRDLIEGLNIGEIRVSMSHCRTHSTATAILMTRG
jgi:holo-[acyl-carrier protein] synthase